MPNRPPSPEMAEFAAQFGGVIERGSDAPFGADTFFDPAYARGIKTLDDFVGQRNPCGLIFKYDIQLFDNLSPNAVCGLVGERFCIGVNLGMHQKIIEIASLICNFYFLPEESLGSRLGQTAGTGFKYIDILTNSQEPEKDYPKFLHSLIERVADAKHVDKFVYLTNSLLLFVIHHEIRHATEGHVQFFNQKRGETRGPIFLGETGSNIPGAQEDSELWIPYLFELDADAKAFLTIAENILAGHLLIVESALSSYERLKLVWIGTLLLANTWSLAEEKEPKLGHTHPPGLLRMLSLSRLPTRADLLEELRRVLAGDEPKGAMVQLYNEGARFAQGVRGLNEEFLGLYAIFTQDAWDYYVKIFYDPDALEFDSRLKSLREQFIYEPKTLVVPRAHAAR